MPRKATAQLRPQATTVARAGRLARAMTAADGSTGSRSRRRAPARVVPSLAVAWVVRLLPSEHADASSVGLVTNVHLQVWTQCTIAMSGLPVPASGRLAFRCYVTKCGLFGEALKARPGGREQIGCDPGRIRSARSQRFDAALHRSDACGQIRCAPGQMFFARSMSFDSDGAWTICDASSHPCDGANFICARSNPICPVANFLCSRA